MNDGPRDNVFSVIDTNGVHFALCWEGVDGDGVLRTYCSLVSRNRRTADRTEAAAVVEYTQAPPATTRLHRLHDQMPTHARFIES